MQTVGWAQTARATTTRAAAAATLIGMTQQEGAGFAVPIDALATSAIQRIAGMARADGVGLRGSDETYRRHMMLAAQGLAEPMLAAAHCLTTGNCHCGSPLAPLGPRVIPIRSMQPAVVSRDRSFLARGLLLHRRTRTRINAQDIEPALMTPLTTPLMAPLRKFEHQTAAACWTT